MCGEPKYITVQEARKILDIPQSTVYRLINAGKIDSIKLGGKILCVVDNIEYCKKYGTTHSKSNVSKTDRRKNPRINIHMSCGYSMELDPKNIKNEAILQNLSPDGVFLNNFDEKLTAVSLDDPVSVRFNLSLDDNKNKEVIVKGRVLRKYVHGFAVKFRQMDENLKEEIKAYIG
ncbi:MAG: helix-turn-helix domain-containing protein [Candidatus Omnitrophota bacterium]|nr:PilZ domain-containing protein [Candidatus Omnitrophota bacterium]MBU1894472.1 PilZ domain-containing protein [Candidatus Omnitrophota bacterium]